MLEPDQPRAGYGDAVVLEDISPKLDEGASLAVLGRNSVGKSTLLLTLMGFTRVHSETVRFRAGHYPYAAAPPRAGRHWLAAQEREIFPSLSVEENLLAAARRSVGTRARSTACFRACRSAARTWATSFPAESSRCSPSPAR